MRFHLFDSCWLWIVLVGWMSHGLFAQTSETPFWQLQDSGVEASLRGLSVVNAKTVWASGSGGTVIKTVDGGESWHDVSPAGAKELDFRDIHAFDSSRAVILSAGQPARVYRTEDGGAHWTLQFEHPDEKSFFDALSFFDEQHGIAMSDPVDDRVLLIETIDGGKTWTELPAERRPRKERGEAGFAASGTNMRVVGDSVFIALGGGEENQSEPTSRVVFSPDRGHSWQAASVPMPRNPSSGIFSMVFIDPQTAVVIGGDYLNQTVRNGTTARSEDGGQTWSVPTGEPPRGYRSGIAAGRQKDRTCLVAVGPLGTDLSWDRGQTWQAASDQGFHAVQFTPDGKRAWASGADGAVGHWPPARSQRSR
ncbi:MAG: YCF48-related protein [Mariniblastus sp.]|nr:YCF48-related protein [Mariniblastus sp.]